ncbi:hypothetical protein [Nonomuraea sp. NPDC049480]|uniref:hypothetical protein n=1 Tax=Nonomuraea sp. NPDC049480 TaxID=3364353 RepID=UPI0037B5E6AB
MSFKEICCELGTALDNEFIRVRADQAELGQELTERINGVANHVKVLDGKVTKLDERVTRVEDKVDSLEAKMEARFEQVDARFEQIDARFEQIDARFEQIDARFEQVDARFDRLETKVVGLQSGQTEMMSILIAIQRKLDVDRPDVDSASVN